MELCLIFEGEGVDGFEVFGNQHEVFEGVEDGGFDGAAGDASRVASCVAFGAGATVGFVFAVDGVTGDGVAVHGRSALGAVE